MAEQAQQNFSHFPQKKNQQKQREVPSDESKEKKNPSSSMAFFKRGAKTKPHYRRKGNAGGFEKREKKAVFREWIFLLFGV